MSARGDAIDCGFAPDELLPQGAGDAGGPSEALARHLAGCPACTRTLAARQAFADRLRELPRLAAPRGPRSALDIAAILERVPECVRSGPVRADESQLDDRLGARLSLEEGWVRRLLASLPRLRAPATLAASLQLPVSARRPRLVFTRSAPTVWISLAAAATLVAAVTIATFRTRGAPVRHGLAAETAALSGRAVIPVRVVRVDPQSPDAEFLRPGDLPGIRSPEPRRGGP